MNRYTISKTYTPEPGKQRFELFNSTLANYLARPYAGQAFFADTFALKDDEPGEAEVFKDVLVVVGIHGDEGEAEATFDLYSNGGLIIDFKRAQDDNIRLTITGARRALVSADYTTPRAKRVDDGSIHAEYDDCGLDANECVCHILTGTPAEHEAALRSIIGTMWDRETHDWKELNSCADAIEAITGAIDQVIDDPEEVCQTCNGEPLEDEPHLGTTTCGTCAGTGSVTR